MSVVLAIIMFVFAEDLSDDEAICKVLGLVFLFVGIPSSIINGILIYGFGELIERTSIISYKERNINDNVETIKSLLELQSTDKTQNEESQFKD